MVLAILDPLEYVTLRFIFMLLCPRICEAAYTFCAVGLGARVCKVLPSGKTLAPEALSPGNRRRQGSEKP